MDKEDVVCVYIYIYIYIYKIEYYSAIKEKKNGILPFAQHRWTWRMCLVKRVRARQILYDIAYM